MKYRSYFLIFYLTFFFGEVCSAQADPVKSTTTGFLQDGMSNLFKGDEIINISLAFDITTYKKNRDSKDYLEGTLTYPEKNDTVTTSVKLRSRGVFRKRYCDLPPIMLNFKPDSGNCLFNYVDKLKLVTECPSGNEEYILKEFLIYKMYNILTENSFKVRLLKVRYINTSRNDKESTEYAFVIEPSEMLAKRIESVEVKTTNLTQKHVKPDQMDRVAIFNYMIGNTDWSVPIAHNIQLFAQYKSERPDLAVIVPYDFDFSGLVNTNYAAPFNTLPIESVRERLYLGICRTKETFMNAFNEFKLKKPEFYKVINEFPYLDRNSKDDMLAYLDTFYEELERPESLARELSKECIRF